MPPYGGMSAFGMPMNWGISAYDRMYPYGRMSMNCGMSHYDGISMNYGMPSYGGMQMSKRWKCGMPMNYRLSPYEMSMRKQWKYGIPMNDGQ
jgi:hypothetical protein